MTSESPVGPLDDDALSALLDRPFTELSVDELMAMKAAYAARGVRVVNSASAEQMILAFLAGNLGTPFLQALSQRAANNVADWSKHVTDAVRKHARRKGQSDDTPWVALPDKVTDDALLALFELAQADKLHGKVAWWDAGVWHVGSMEEYKRATEGETDRLRPFRRPALPEHAQPAVLRRITGTGRYAPVPAPAVFGYLIAPRKARQVSALNVSVPPSRSVVSRKAMVSAAWPTSTQLPPLLPL
jgi:hypothetical protein